MTKSEILTIICSLLALTISLISLVRTRKHQDRILQLEEINARLSQKQLEELESADKQKLKANVDVYRQDGSLVISNNGESEASNVSLSFASSEQNLLARGEFDKFPLRVLQPFKSFKLLGFYNTDQSPEQVQVVVRWTNLDGTKGENVVDIQC
ncbi:hypothetical protein [Alteromonas sp. PRIM-21]|uniref:hypothetical protein n=1 Tax=Alteromonas sp. PRIM-21 TaxID=1454978 RepID=UPI0022B9C8AA|nr:hypothetical protein [Alteromonas sp. PRIM-21]MCZ8529132.1 hypothetical protein [Alteromonas sp. PRIM-21]